MTPQEVSCAHLIENQLMVLTKNYLLHLRKQAHKINPKVIIDEDIKSLPQLNEPSKGHSAYEKIAAKFEKVCGLIDQLTDSQTNPLPSSRISQFTQLLKEDNAVLKQQRNSEWSHFVKSCLVAIGVICTGIIPGITALLVYSSYTRKSSPLFFTKSHGEEYCDEVEASLGLK